MVTHAPTFILLILLLWSLCLHLHRRVPIRLRRLLLLVCNMRCCDPCRLTPWCLHPERLKNLLIPLLYASRLRCCPRVSMRLSVLCVFPTYLSVGGGASVVMSALPTTAVGIASFPIYAFIDFFFKAKPCRFFHINGRCAKGDRCNLCVPTTGCRSSHVNRPRIVSTTTVP